MGMEGNRLRSFPKEEVEFNVTGSFLEEDSRIGNAIEGHVAPFNFIAAAHRSFANAFYGCRGVSSNGATVFQSIGSRNKGRILVETNVIHVDFVILGRGREFDLAGRGFLVVIVVEGKDNGLPLIGL